VLKANESLHQMLASKENQDYTAIQSSMDAMKENKAYKDMIAEIMKVLGVDKPVLGDILNRMLLIKDLADKQLRVNAVSTE